LAWRDLSDGSRHVNHILRILVATFGRRIYATPLDTLKGSGENPPRKTKKFGIDIDPRRPRRHHPTGQRDGEGQATALLENLMGLGRQF
jgi:hypothetical protein